ncbi:double-stranded RNA-specific editase B2-like [Drosophila sechellia]|uniref:double-stranded RNA-specific editase B2-like n=1 Tax=Drosophila sechellia TaxID=7238 RepID=UPI0013DDADC9|nr:double-stranded RNA-specific editase B2-like [Drosophila sechellia]
MKPSVDIIEDNTSASGIGGKIPFKKIFQKRKKSSGRDHQRFTIDINTDGGFTAVVTVNSTQYVGKGTSKMTAKNAACEKAWRDFIIAKMTPKPPRIHQVEIGAEPIDTNEDEADAPDDDLPICSRSGSARLCRTRDAPFGQCCPAGRRDAGTPVPAAPKEPKKPPVRTELPSGWETMHPATILCIMRPGLSYSDYGSSGDNTTGMQHLGITVDNQEFHAHGRSKKIARLNVAVKVCNSLFGTNFAYGDTV